MHELESLSNGASRDNTLFKLPAISKLRLKATLDFGTFQPPLRLPLVCSLAHAHSWHLLGRGAARLSPSPSTLVCATPRLSGLSIRPTRGERHRARSYSLQKPCTYHIQTDRHKYSHQHVMCRQRLCSLLCGSVYCECEKVKVRQKATISFHSF